MIGNKECTRLETGVCAMSSGDSWESCVETGTVGLNGESQKES